MSQELNEDICKIYQQKRQYLRELKIFNDAIVQRELSGQLQQKCDIPEIWALNIVNGYYMQDYLAACAYRQKETDSKEEEEKRRFIEELLQEADMWYKASMIVNIEKTKKCAFCKHWYDPSNGAIKPRNPHFNQWEFDDQSRKMCN